jgi:3-methyladenine DNA glycosylase AlkD
MPRFAARSVARELERALRAAGTSERAAQEKRYLRSALEHTGATVPAIRKAAIRVARGHPDLERRDVLALVRALWTRPVHECRMAAIELLQAYVDRVTADDLGLLERFLRESRTWALIDGLAANVVGVLVERCPDLAPELDRWAQDEDFWIRRSALLAELIPLRQGRGDIARFARHADAMLEETEFFIRKAIGWVLREASKPDPARVVRWLTPRAERASTVTVREAVKYLPANAAAAIRAASRRAAKKTLTGRAAARRNAAPTT